MEHLMNCHGEWLWLLQALAVLPFVGIWVRNKLHKHEDHDEPHH